MGLLPVSAEAVHLSSVLMVEYFFPVPKWPKALVYERAGSKELDLVLRVVKRLHLRVGFHCVKDSYLRVNCLSTYTWPKM